MTSVAEHARAVAMIVGGEITWCRARILHALAHAERQGVLRDALGELVDDETADEIATALRANGWLERAAPFRVEHGGTGHYEIGEHEIAFAVAGVEMLRIGPDGAFYVRGRRIDAENDVDVYRAFREWLAAATVNGRASTGASTHKLRVDTSAFCAAVDQIAAEVDRISVAAKPETAQRIVEAVQRVTRGVHFPLHLDPSTAGADDDRIALEVPQGLLDLLAALRAFDGHGEFVFQFGHEAERTPGTAPEGAAPDDRDRDLVEARLAIPWGELLRRMGSDAATAKEALAWLEAHPDPTFDTILEAARFVPARSPSDDLERALVYLGDHGVAPDVLSRALEHVRAPGRPSAKRLGYALRQARSRMVQIDRLTRCAIVCAGEDPMGTRRWSTVTVHAGAEPGGRSD